MPVVSYRPRSGPELVDAAFQLFRQHFTRFVTLQAVLYLPWLVLTVLLGRTAGLDLMSGSNPNAGMVFAVMVLSVLWYSLMDGTMVYAAGQTYLGHEVTVESALRHGASRIGRLLGAELLKWMLVFIGFIFFIIPGLILYARYFAVPATVVLEDNDVGGALRRSRELASGMKGRILAIMLLPWIGYFIVYFTIAAIVASVTRSAVVAEGAMMVVSVFVYPLFFILGTLLYYDARIRKEALDIELLTAQLGGREQQPA